VRVQFWLVAVPFHLLLIAVGVRWLRRTRPDTDGAFTLVGGAAVFAAAATLLAAGAAVLSTNGFTAVRLLSQALFGETIVLSLVMAWRHGRARRWRASCLVILPLGLLGIYWDAYHVEPHALEISRHTVDLAHAAVHEERLRIVHLTDIQTDRVGPYERRVFEEAMAQKPDLIVLTGDYIQPRLEPTRATATADLKALLHERPLHAPLGVYAVRGDVDGSWPGVLAGTGITTLTGDTARVALPGGRWLSLVGLTIGMSRGQEDAALRRLLADVPVTDLRVVIGHNPNFVASLAGIVPIDLALAGHTHGGQVVLPFFGAPMTKMILPRHFASGLHDYEGIPLHVSRGIGMERGTAPQVRFLCRPEICVLDVAYANAAESVERAPLAHEVGEGSR
jgi:predicted MPP superfamily phosphohydrolase